MPRFFTRDADGNPVLLLAIDPKTREITYRADEEIFTGQREKNIRHMSQFASELAMRDPTSQFFAAVAGEAVRR